MFYNLVVTILKIMKHLAISKKYFNTIKAIDVLLITELKNIEDFRS